MWCIMITTDVRHMLAMLANGSHASPLPCSVWRGTSRRRGSATDRSNSQYVSAAPQTPRNHLLVTIATLAPNPGAVAPLQTASGRQSGLSAMTSALAHPASGRPAHPACGNLNMHVVSHTQPARVKAWPHTEPRCNWNAMFCSPCVLRLLRPRGVAEDLSPRQHRCT